MPKICSAVCQRPRNTHSQRQFGGNFYWSANITNQWDAINRDTCATSQDCDSPWPFNFLTLGRTAGQPLANGHPSLRLPFSHLHRTRQPRDDEHLNHGRGRLWPIRCFDFGQFRLRPIRFRPIFRCSISANFGLRVGHSVGPEGWGERTVWRSGRRAVLRRAVRARWKLRGVQV